MELFQPWPLKTGNWSYNRDKWSDFTLWLVFVPTWLLANPTNPVRPKLQSTICLWCRTCLSGYLGVQTTWVIGSIYGIFTYIYHKNHLNVSKSIKYTIHGSYILSVERFQSWGDSCEGLWLKVLVIVAVACWIRWMTLVFLSLYVPWNFESS